MISIYFCGIRRTVAGMEQSSYERAQASKARVEQAKYRKAVGTDPFSWKVPSWVAGTLVLGLLALIALMVCQWTGFLGL